MLTAIFSAAVFACELGLVALSFNLAYKVIGFANFAHVEFVTIGGYVAFSAAGVVSLPLAIAAAAGAGGLVSLFMYAGIFHRLRNTSVGTRMIASAGLATGIRGFEQLVWGVNAESIPHAPTATIAVGGAFITVVQIILIATTIGIVGLFAVLLKTTRIGRNVRAVSDNPGLSEVRGVSSSTVRNQVCFVAGALAGLAGALYGLNSLVLPTLGLDLLVPMFAACIVGGAGSPFGALLGATLVSAVSTAVVTINFGKLVGSSFYLGSQWQTVVAFVFLILVLAVRPSGFFGEERQRA